MNLLFDIDLFYKTNRNLLIIDSSPKCANKISHLLNSESLSDTVNMLSTPTRKSRLKTSSPNFNTSNDDSPMLSQVNKINNNC